jgi:hypothetical protein
VLLSIPLIQFLPQREVSQGYHASLLFGILVATSCKFEVSYMIDSTVGMMLEAVMWLPVQTVGVLPHILQEISLCCQSISGWQVWSESFAQCIEFY